MYQNLRWIADTHATLDWAEVRDKLPVNPPGSHFREGFDVMIEDVDVLNWHAYGPLVDGSELDVFEFRPRLRDNVQQVPRSRIRMALVDEAPELDDDYELDCD